jgi:hypothetical protein
VGCELVFAAAATAVGRALRVSIEVSEAMTSDVRHDE